MSVRFTGELDLSGGGSFGPEAEEGNLHAGLVGPNGVYYSCLVLVASAGDILCV